MSTKTFALNTNGTQTEIRTQQAADAGTPLAWDFLFNLVTADHEALAAKLTTTYEARRSPLGGWLFDLDWDALDALETCESFDELLQAAMRPNTWDELLAIANNPNTSGAILFDLYLMTQAHGEHPLVTSDLGDAVLRHPNAPIELLSFIAFNGGNTEAVASNPSTPAHLLVHLANTEVVTDAVAAVVFNANTPAFVRSALTRDPREGVRYAVARCKLTTIADLGSLIFDKSSQIGAAALQQIADRQIVTA